MVRHSNGVTDGSSGCVGRTGARAFVSLGLVLSFLLVFANPASAVTGPGPCNTTSPRVGADGATSTTYGNVIGMRGELYVPAISSSNYSSFMRSDSGYDTADFALVTPPGQPFQFVQLGWHIGTSSSNTTKIYTPRLFYGQNEGSGEYLVDLGPVTTGAFVRLELRQNTTTNKYHIFVNNTQVAITKYAGPTSMIPRVIAETYVSCNRMYTLARAGNYPLDSTQIASLEYYRTSSGFQPWQYHVTFAGGQAAGYESCTINSKIGGVTPTEQVDGPRDGTC